MRKVVAEALTLRVAARFQVAMEFPNSEALKEYLHEHPHADKSRHVVKKPEHESKPKEEGGEDKPKEKKLRSWKEIANGLSEKAKSFVQSAPKAVKDFVHDESYRSKALKSAHDSIKKAPGEFVRRVIHEGKEEAKEIQTAGSGLVSVLRGKKMSHEQKHALRKVATHIAIATAATALTGGLALGAAGLAKGAAGAFVSSLSKKIAIKAVTHKLQSLPTMEELGHAGHGAAHHVTHMFQHFLHHAAEEKEIDPQQAFEAFVAATIAEALKDLDPDTVAEAIEEAAKGQD